MPRENEDLDGALREFCRCLSRGEFFEAHEVLEEAWHPLRRNKDPLASPVKGLINAAIAFEHLRRNRPKSRRVATVAMEGYLRRVRREERLDAAYELVESLRETWKI
jgi:predicted metal-dependent hydrolase